MQMDGFPGELSSYPRSDSPSGYHLSSGESKELSVIPTGSWGDVVRRFTMIRWGRAQRAALLLHACGRWRTVRAAVPRQSCDGRF
ncbi:hypothetical protein F511_29174 [Dorcoceras hygrometricum]|uniref:Uncharacterized protein n=1 Tax=Dorcoceras hygrometricum TaxID=472368 RepID=A0A2Z7BNE4_9LAMI|nr:hypothetical protein F511_29174 [Dorcoceras hygrometricum]